MFLKQSNSLAQKQETVIVLIKFCSLKGSQMFSTLDRCALSSFFSCFASSADTFEQIHISHLMRAVRQKYQLIKKKR